MAMFEEAAPRQAVLLLDEADSFLRSRRMAERHYEVSEVNEMLQGMERFAGVFICTTNLFQELDEAALRRFTFRSSSSRSRRQQRERMFVAEALGGDAGALNDEQRKRLRAGTAGAGRLRGRQAAGRRARRNLQAGRVSRPARGPSTASSRRCGSARHRVRAVSPSVPSVTLRTPRAAGALNALPAGR